MAKLKKHPVSELTIMIEHKYGSILKCPDTDPMLITLHKLTSRMLDTSNQNNALKGKSRKEAMPYKKKAHALAMQGYSDTEIGKMIKANRTTVRNWLSDITNRPVKFTRIVVSNSTGNRIYFLNSKGIRKWCNQVGRKFLAVNRGYDKLFSTQEIEVHWHELPIGAIYQSAEQDKFYIKENDDTYAQGKQYHFGKCESNGYKNQ